MIPYDGFTRVTASILTSYSSVSYCTKLREMQQAATDNAPS